MRTRAAFLVLLLLLLAGGLRAAPFGKNKVQLEAPHWQILTTEHFLIHYHDAGRGTGRPGRPHRRGGIRRTGRPPGA